MKVWGEVGPAERGSTGLRIGGAKGFKAGPRQSYINTHGKGGPGYRFVLDRENPKANARGYIAEHRLVMSRIIGRDLHSFENVHHINGDTLDNRPTNLELWVTMQPSGQRPVDLIAYAREIIALYGEKFG